MKPFLTALLLMFALSTAVVGETFDISYENGQLVRRFPEGTRPVIGLALSGGGARGFAHIGVIEVLEEKGVRIDRIAGTSMGSIVGGLYAAGYSTHALRDIIDNIDWTETFSSTPRRRSTYIGEKETSEWPLFELRFEGWRARIPSSLSSGQRTATLLSWLTLGSTYECGRDFDRLSIPFRSITTDLKTDRSVILGEGDLGLAIRASSTIPLLFAPVEFDGMLLVDGGLKDNLPVDAARNMGSDFVIAVAIDESMHNPDELDNPVNVADQVTSILMRNITRLSKSQADFIINPDMEAFSSSSFSNSDAVIEQGRKAALEAYPALRDSVTALMTRSRTAYIESISVLPAEYETDALSVVERHISLNETNHFADISGALESLWATGRFADIHAELRGNGSLIITLKEAPASVTLNVITRNHTEKIDRTYTFSTLNGNRPSMTDAVARVDSLVRLIRTDGYSFAKPEKITIDTKNKTMIVEVPVPKVTRILVEEGLKSRNSLIMREFEQKAGDILDMNKVMRSVENLYGTNLFELVNVDVEPHEGGVGIRVYLKEKNWTVARFGLRYNETFKTEGRVALTQENILGFGNQITLTGHTGERRQLIMLENKSSRVYKSLYTFSLKTYRTFRKHPVYKNQALLYDFEDERFGTIIGAGQQMDKLGNALFQFKTETVRTRFAPSVGVKDANKEFRSFIFRSLIDSYDRYPFPQNGYMNHIYIESATAVLGGSDQFVKIYWGSSFARTYGRKHTFLGMFSFGSTDPSTPNIDVFTLGGHATRLNCYDIESAGSHFYADFPGLTDEERRGTRLAAGKMTYRLFIPRAFYLDLIYGIGNVWGQGETITVKSLLQSYGIRGSFATFAGPLSFGWGITSEGDDRTHISAGWDF